MINYRLATRDDLEKIAKIHINEFSKYFLSVLGEKLVCKFYESYYEETDNILVITEKEEKLIGFILGTKSSLAREKFFKENFNKIFWKLFEEFFKGNKILWMGISRRLFFIKEAIIAKLYKKKEFNFSKSIKLIQITFNSNKKRRKRK